MIPSKCPNFGRSLPNLEIAQYLFVSSSVSLASAVATAAAPQLSCRRCVTIAPLCPLSLRCRRARCPRCAAAHAFAAPPCSHRHAPAATSVPSSCRRVSSPFAGAACSSPLPSPHLPSPLVHRSLAAAAARSLPSLSPRLPRPSSGHVCRRRAAVSAFERGGGAGAAASRSQPLHDHPHAARP